MLVTTLRCWWRFWPFWSPTSTIVLPKRTKERWICPDRQATWRLYIVIQQMILVSRQYLLDLGYSSNCHLINEYFKIFCRSSLREIDRLSKRRYCCLCRISRWTTRQMCYGISKASWIMFDILYILHITNLLYMQYALMYSL